VSRATLVSWPVNELVSHQSGQQVSASSACLSCDSSLDPTTASPEQQTQTTAYTVKGCRQHGFRDGG